MPLVHIRPVRRLLKRGGGGGGGEFKVFFVFVVCLFFVVVFLGFFLFVFFVFVFFKGANLKKILILRPKFSCVNSVSGEKLHEFEIICPARGCVHTPAPCVRACI